MDLIADLVKERFETDIARELCQKSSLFELGRLYSRSHITETLRDEFVKRGRASDTRKEAVANVLKKWLLGPDSPFRRETRGRYRFLGSHGAIEQALHVKDRVNAGSDAFMAGTLAPEREIGAGPCEVYAWCLPRYQATSGDRWPIKIGKAGSDGLSRRVRDFHDNLFGRPRYLLRIRCVDER